MTPQLDNFKVKHLGQHGFRRSSHVNQANTITYDDANRKSTETITYPGGFSMGYRYDYSPAGKKTQLTWPDGTQIGYTYSAHGELDSVTIPGEGSISVTQFKWTAPEKITLPGGSTQNKGYDGLLNLEDFSVKTAGQQNILELSHRYGKVQELTQRTRTDTLITSNGGNTTSASSTKAFDYQYDKETRLTQVRTDSGGLFGSDTDIFTLDAVANRTAYSKQNGTWRYDENNRLLQRGNGNCGASGVVCYDYDTNGNTIKKNDSGTITLYSYNVQNQLIAVKDNNNQLIARYGYDLLNRRLWKEQYRSISGTALTPAKRTYFLYADEGLIAEATQDITLNNDQSVSGIGSPVITTQYGIKPDNPFTTGTLFIKTKNSNGTDSIAYYQHDHLQTPLQATDKAGHIVWSAQYAAFGQATITTPVATAEQPTISSNLRLPGQYFDVETGLHYNYHRDYDPATGRYIQSDPIGLDGGINTYAYVEGDPLGDVDPTGEFGLAGAAIGAGIDLGIQIIIEGKSLKCVDWWQVGAAGAMGAVGGGGLGGAYRHSKSGKSWWDASQKWKNVSPRVRKAQNTPAGTDLHHWFIERNSPVGKYVPDFIKNHPWNLNPVTKQVHKDLHLMNPFERTVRGAPDWAKAAGGSAAAGGVGSAAQGDGCGCN
jgi:RHS repeat-associated protein